MLTDLKKGVQIMSEVVNVDDGVVNNPDPASGLDQAKQKDTVAYETYRKTVDAEKKAKLKADELSKKLREYEEKDLAAQGKSQELIESLRKQVGEKEAKLQDVVGSFAYRAVASRIREEAVKQGCLDVDLLLKAGSEEFGKIEVNAEDGFSVNGDDLKRFFETTVTKHPMLFKKAGPKVIDGAPANSAASIGSKPLNEMKSSELIEAWKNLK